MVAQEFQFAFIAAVIMSAALLSICLRHRLAKDVWRDLSDIAEEEPTSSRRAKKYGLASHKCFASRRKRHLRELTFYLPIVMERIVMAVQAGADIVAALHIVLDLDYNKSPATESKKAVKRDPISHLLQLVYQLTESGLSLEESLYSVSSLVDLPAVRHAFMHLALAHKDGGELVMPLRELSDSTQLYFQESVEEEIAALPVKATLPLVCTFAGLIICFIASPLVQVLELTARAMPK